LLISGCRTAAHLRLAAVSVEHAHAHVGLVRRQDKDEAVAADAEVPIGDLLRNGRRVGDRFFEAVDVNVVVTEAVHLGETHGEED
jgi:hypothetical protein